MVECPICRAACEPLEIGLTFAPKPNLPTRIALMSCGDCDFAFVHPRVAVEIDYYRETQNDILHGPELYRNTVQLERIAGLIASNDSKSVLDFGCGGGGLTSALAERFPEARFAGYDVNANFPRAARNASFSTRLGDGPYDLIVMSHVAEHLCDFSVLDALFSRLAEGGLVYIEVPDPARYGAVGQPHFLYYVDRLHVNHFSQKALGRLLPDAFTVEAFGGYEMPYDEGPLYPSRYVVARKAASRRLKDDLLAYSRAEAEAHAAVRRSLQDRRFYIYGYGDNFFRARSPGGPLFGLEGNIVAVIDRGAGALVNAPGDSFTFLAPGEPLTEEGASIVCAVTRNAVGPAFFAEAYPGREVVRL